MQPLNCNQSSWYQEHLEPHESMLKAWLQSRFTSTNDVEDVLQESLLRVLNSKNLSQIQSPKAFLFATARNIVLMRFRKQKVRKEISLTDLEDSSVCLDEQTCIFENVAQNEELEILTKAIQSLPTRCRQVLTLRKIYGMSQKEIARTLNISENTVENQGSIGMHKISKFFEKYRANGEHTT